MTRRCRRCGKVGPRIPDAGGYLHSRCLTRREKRDRRIVNPVLPLLERKP